MAPDMSPFLIGALCKLHKVRSARLYSAVLDALIQGDGLRDLHVPWSVVLILRRGRRFRLFAENTIHFKDLGKILATSLIIAMTSNLTFFWKILATNLIAMASNLIAMAPT